MEQITISKENYNELYVKALKYDALEKRKICVYSKKNFDSNHLQLAGGEYFILGATYEEYQKFLEEKEIPYLKNLNDEYYQKFVKVWNFFNGYKTHYERLPKWLKKWYMPDLTKLMEELKKDLRTWKD